MKATGMATGLRAGGRARFLVVALLLAVMAVSGAALATTRPRTTTYTGSILLAHGAYNAVTAVGAACNPTSPLNGIDGVWYKIPRGATRVSFAPSALLDADLLFRTAECQGNADDGGLLAGQGSGQIVSGRVPGYARFVLVNGWLGTGAFSITFIR